MQKLVLVAFVGLIGVLVLLVAVLLAMPYITNLETVRTQMASTASAMLQRPVTLTRLSLQAIPSPGVRIEGLTVAERDGAPIATVDELITEVKLFPLLNRRFVVDRVIVVHPRLNLTRNPDGSLNLPLPPPSAAPPVPTGSRLPPLTVALDEVRLENGDVVVRNKGRSGGAPLAQAQGLTVLLKDVSLAPAAKPDPGPTAILKRLTAGGSLALRSASYQAMKLDDLRANLVVKDGVARLHDISLALFGGKGTGRLTADLSQVTPRLDTTFTLETLQVDKLFEAVQAQPAPISGSLSLQESLTTSGMKPDEIMRGLTGTARFEIKDGTIRKMEALGKMLTILNLKRLFTGTLPDMSRDGVPFDRITGTLQFKNGIMTTDDLALHSPAIDVGVKGAVSLPDRNLNMVASALGMDFDVQGPADNPTVSSRAMKGIKEGIGGLLEKGLGLFR